MPPSQTLSTLISAIFFPGTISEGEFTSDYYFPCTYSVIQWICSGTFCINSSTGSNSSECSSSVFSGTCGSCGCDAIGVINSFKFSKSPPGMFPSTGGEPSSAPASLSPETSQTPVADDTSAAISIFEVPMVLSGLALWVALSL